MSPPARGPASRPDKWKLSPFLRQCAVCLSVGCTTLGHGSTTGVLAVLLAQLHDVSGTAVTADHIAWASSIASPTMAVGAWLVCPVMGRLGRRAAHLAVSAPALAAWLIIAFADTFTLIMVGRVLQGLTLGMMMPLRSTLLGEYTSPRYRGAFLGTLSLAQGAGVLVVHLIGAFLHWRTTCLLCSLFHVVSLVLIFFTPESPSWLADKEKFEECKEAFKSLRGDDENKELDKLIRAKLIVYDTQKIKNMSDVIKVIKKKEFYKPIILMMHLYASSEFSGSSIIAIYSAIVLATVVGPNIDIKLWTLMFDVNRIVTGAFLIYVARKLRRKVLMISTSGLCIVSYLVIVGYLYMKSYGMLSNNAWLPLVLLHVTYFAIVFVLGTPYIIAGEIFPLQYRSVGSSISVLSLSATFFVMTKTFPGLVASVGLGYTYLMYAGMLTYFSIVIALYLPETKGKTLLQIEEEFMGKTVDETMAKNDELLENPSETLLDDPSNQVNDKDSGLRPKV